MTNMRRGFTMIELIFVIVIIGILAAVAIPKLAATRDDAKVSNIIANARTAYGDFTAYYTSQGNARWGGADSQFLDDVTNVNLSAASCGTIADPGAQAIVSTFQICDTTPTTPVACVSFVTTADGNLSVTSIAAGNSVICDGVVADSAIIGLAGGAGGSTKVHQLGGVGVIR